MRKYFCDCCGAEMTSGTNSGTAYIKVGPGKPSDQRGVRIHITPTWDTDKTYHGDPPTICNPCAMKALKERFP